MPRNNPNAQNCPFPNCNTRFNLDRDRTRQYGLHDIRVGHTNAYVCEVCCDQFSRTDSINTHRRRFHGLEKTKMPFGALEYCGNFKFGNNEKMRCVSRRNVITITNVVRLTEQDLGVFNARYVNHYPNYSRRT